MANAESVRLMLERSPSTFTSQPISSSSAANLGMNPKWQEILEQVTTLRQESAKLGVKLWYRGQRVAGWPIRSTLHRRVIEYFERTKIHFGNEDTSFLREEYKSVYRTFKAQAWHLLDPIERGDWGIVFRMQHHGFPTRLLDWTKSFACALYFAHWQRDPSEDAAVYVLNPEGLNLISAGREGLIALDEEAANANIDIRPYIRDIWRRRKNSKRLP